MDQRTRQPAEAHAEQQSEDVHVRIRQNRLLPALEKPHHADARAKEPSHARQPAPEHEQNSRIFSDPLGKIKQDRDLVRDDEPKHKHPADLVDRYVLVEVLRFGVEIHRSVDAQEHADSDQQAKNLDRKGITTSKRQPVREDEVLLRGDDVRN